MKNSLCIHHQNIKEAPDKTTPRTAMVLPVLMFLTLWSQVSGESGHVCVTLGQHRALSMTCNNNNGLPSRLAISSVYYRLSNQGCTTQDSALASCVAAQASLTEDARSRCNWQGQCNIGFTYPNTPECDASFRGTIVLFAHYECYTVLPGEDLYPRDASYQNHRGSRVHLLSASYPNPYEVWPASSSAQYSCNILSSNNLLVKVTVADISYEATSTLRPYCLTVDGFTTCAENAALPITHYMNVNGGQNTWHLSLTRNFTGSFSARYWIIVQSAIDADTLANGDVMAVSCGDAYVPPTSTISQQGPYSTPSYNGGGFSVYETPAAGGDYSTQTPGGGQQGNYSTPVYQGYRSDPPWTAPSSYFTTPNDGRVINDVFSGQPAASEVWLRLSIACVALALVLTRY